MFFSVIGAFGTNAQPASSGCSTQRVWDYPNKHFATQKWRLYIRTPCLLRNFLPYSYYNENPILPKQGIKKRCNPHKRLQRSFLPIQFSCSTSAISFAVAVTIRIPLSLIPSSSASSCRRPVLFPAVLSGKKNWSTDMS